MSTDKRKQKRNDTLIKLSALAYALETYGGGLLGVTEEQATRLVGITSETLNQFEDDGELIEVYSEVRDGLFEEFDEVSSEENAEGVEDE